MIVFMEGPIRKFRRVAEETKDQVSEVTTRVTNSAREIGTATAVAATAITIIAIVALVVAIVALDRSADVSRETSRSF